MTNHLIATNPDSTATSIILQQRGLRGMEFVLAKGNVDDNDETHKATLENPGAIIGSYFLEANKLRDFIKVLQTYHDLVAQYHVIVEHYLGWEDKDFRETVIRSEYIDQEGAKFINMGMMNMALYVDSADNHEAVEKVTQKWEETYGSLDFWGISFDASSSAVWRKAMDIPTAIKFESWFYETYIAPQLAVLQQNS